VIILMNFILKCLSFKVSSVTLVDTLAEGACVSVSVGGLG